MTVTITIDAPDAAAARAEMHALLYADALARQRGENLDGSPRRETVAATTTETASPEPAEPVVTGEAYPPTDAPKRERGQPSPGKKRRTNAEIAEDDAFDKVKAYATENPEVVPAMAAAADAFAQLQAGISTTPEDRQDPANPEPADDAETVAADAADEAAETAETKTGLTLDDVRKVLGIYVTAYGMAAAQVDGPKIIATVLGKTHDDNAPCKVSDLPDDKIEAAIAEIKLAGKENRFARTAVSS